ncbi:hypothetical protein [Pectobacterium polaris]|uniref:hypothetical protein n=1 Tax=Pectobacterium polaris TaxID=2042057 RepID=UPI0015841CA3|nr:hypothetical protein [Pectobacterium polaris]
MLYVYGGDSCQELSKTLKIDDNLLSIVFSIVSDDRLPFCLDKLKNHIFEDKYNNYHIHVLGDLIGLPLTQWRVRNYLKNELSFFAKDRNIHIYWYDGDKIRDGNYFFIHNPLHIDKISHFDYRHNELAVENFDASTKEINFLNHRAYPENNLLGKTKKEVNYIFATIAELPFVEKIVCPFIDNLQIRTLPKSLKKLDLRGCTNLKVDPKCIPIALEKINLSACDFIEIPDYVYDLSELNTLFLYKNKLEINGVFKIPKNLEFLSLYRNKINSIEFDTIKLKKINLGANPIKKIIISSATEGIELGLRKVNCEELMIIHDHELTLEF